MHWHFHSPKGATSIGGALAVVRPRSGGRRSTASAWTASRITALFFHYYQI